MIYAKHRYLRKVHRMSTDFAVVNTDSQLQSFSVSDAAIAEMAEQYMPLTIAGVNDSAGFKQVHEARMVVKSRRVEVEKVRKALKADALEYGRKVDAEAKRLTGLLEPIEFHLESEEKRIQDEKERIRNAARLKAEAEARAKAEAEAAKVRAEQEALRAAQEAEAAKLSAEREKLEAERIAMEAERRRIEAERRSEQERLDVERRKVEAEQQRLAKIEADRQLAVELEKAKAEAAERAKRETEARLAREAAAAKAKAEAVEAARLRAEALRPDMEKLLAIAIKLRTIQIPSVSAGASGAAEEICRVLRKAAMDVERIAAGVGAVDESVF